MQISFRGSMPSLWEEANKDSFPDIIWILGVTTESLLLFISCLDYRPVCKGKEVSWFTVLEWSHGGRRSSLKLCGTAAATTTKASWEFENQWSKHGVGRGKYGLQLNAFISYLILRISSQRVSLSSGKLRFKSLLCNENLLDDFRPFSQIYLIGML